MATEMNGPAALEPVVTDDLLEKIAEVRKELGDKVLILGHHYQRNEVIRFADKTGDSYALSKYAAEKSDAEYIIFCGVHFMAETADILTPSDRVVVLPDLKAGCSMADMANADDLEDCWEILTDSTDETIIPITYVNSTAAIKAFVGRNGGAVCTSSNAHKVVKWAYERGDKILFLPDQHLGRNTTYKMGIPLEDMVIYDPLIENGGASNEEYARAKVILWQGYCSVHMNFQPQHIDMFREKHPDINIIVHPECTFEVVEKADYAGSTAFIINTIENADPGTKWAVGTEHNLVNRLTETQQDKTISTLAPFACQCSTMYRISPEWLLRSLECIRDGKVENRISVPEEIAKDARLSLNRMLEITG